jgi:hypothetical protein
LVRTHQQWCACAGEVPSSSRFARPAQPATNRPEHVIFVFVIVLAACAFAGYSIGKPKGYAGGGLALGLLLGIIGVIIIACVPTSREAKVREAQRSIEIQAEAARRAGFGQQPGYGVPPQPGQPYWFPPQQPGTGEGQPY